MSRAPQSLGGGRSVTVVLGDAKEELRRHTCEFPVLGEACCE